MNKLRTVGFMLAAGAGLLLLGSTASAQSHLTGPPWGEEGGPKIVFGAEDKGVLQFDYKGQFRMTARNTGSGALNSDSTTNFGFRRNRLALRGAWGDKFSLYVQTEFTENPNVETLGVASANLGTDFQLLDAVARFDLHDSFKINVGKFKYNLSRENLESCEEPLTLDRSLFIRAPYVGTRDTGVAIWGNLVKDRIQYRADAMEGRQAVSGETTPASNFRYSFRGHVTLLDPENGYGYKGTYLGEKKVLTIGAAYQMEKKLTYTDTVSLIQPRDYKAWTIDGFFEYPMESVGTVTLSGAYEKVDLGGAYQGAHPDSGSLGINGEKNGWYGKAGYLVKNTKLQFFGRYEKWRFASLNNTIDEMVDWYGGGANYFVWKQSLKLSAEFNHTKFDKGSLKDFNTFVTQMQLVF
jgi:hypothetical protein